MKAGTLVGEATEIDCAGVSEPTFDVHDMVAMLVGRGRFLLALTIGAAVLAAIVVLIIPSRYTAETIVMPPSQNDSMSSALLGQLAGSGTLASMAGASLGIKSPGDMYVALFRSRTVEDAMIQRFGLMGRYRASRMSNARKAFEAKSTVAFAPKTGLITIEVTDRDPNLAAQMANAYTAEFRKFSANLAITEASQRRAFFQQQLLEANENLTSAEEAMKRTEQTTGVVEIGAQTRALVESAASIRAQIVAKDIQLRAIRTYAAEDNPELVTVKQQLSALQEELARLSGPGQDSGSGMILPKSKVPEAGMEYVRRLRDMKYYETVSELLAKQFELAKVDEARQGAGIQVVDSAVTPDHRSFPKRTLTVLFSAIIAFFAAVGWCIVSEGWRQRGR
jgi:tyrosine-protein kinase Etk/Wzc